MESGNRDFMNRYKAINAKLKKRFMRKPNEAEASAEFKSLAKELENEECPHYSAFCLMAVARCEKSIGNADEESQSHVKAARLFLEAEELNHELLCPGFSENLNAALSCYHQAFDVYREQGQFALLASLYLETGESLRHLRRVAQSIKYYQEAAELMKQCPADYLNVLKIIANCKLKTYDYDGALNYLTDVCCIAEENCPVVNGLKVGAFAATLAEAEITKVLLLLYLQPPPLRMKPENAKTLEKYSWDSKDGDASVNYIPEEEFLLMQSFVMAHQSQDLKTMRELEKDLWQFLTADQIDLLHTVVEKIE